MRRWGTVLECDLDAPVARILCDTTSCGTENRLPAPHAIAPIDNNVSVREMKRVVLNRKNSLFVGNARGGRTAAILASLTSS